MGINKNIEVAYIPAYKISLFLFTILIVSSHYCFGQTKKCHVKGDVIHYKTRQKMEAKVVFEKQPDASLTVISQSGNRGYRANLFERGEYLCLVSAEGYVSEQCTFNLLSDSLAEMETLTRNFELIPIALNEVLPFEKILFDVARFQLSPGSIPELSRLFNMLSENPTIKVRLEGHTDNFGKSRKSMVLAKRRIEEVKKWLINKGVKKSRISLKAFGGEKPKTTTDATEVRQVNRRVEVRVIHL